MESNPYTTNDQRKGKKRLPICSRVELTTKELKIIGESTDLSETGIFVKANHLFAKGTEVRGLLWFNESVFTFNGIVVRKAESPHVGVGIQFVNLSLPNQVNIKYLLSMLRMQNEATHVKMSLENPPKEIAGFAWRSEKYITLRHFLSPFSLGSVVQIADETNANNICQGTIVDVQLETENKTPCLEVIIRPHALCPFDWIYKPPKNDDGFSSFFFPDDVEKKFTDELENDEEEEPLSDLFLQQTESEHRRYIVFTSADTPPINASMNARQSSLASHEDRVSTDAVKKEGTTKSASNDERLSSEAVQKEGTTNSEVLEECDASSSMPLSRRPINPADIVKKTSLQSPSKTSDNHINRLSFTQGMLRNLCFIFQHRIALIVFVFVLFILSVILLFFAINLGQA